MRIRMLSSSARLNCKKRSSQSLGYSQRPKPTVAALTKETDGERAQHEGPVALPRLAGESHEHVELHRTVGQAIASQ